MNWLLLWDIDRTLVFASNRDRRVYQRITQAMTGQPATNPPRSGLGSREPDIVRAYLRGAGLTAEATEAALPSTLARVVADLSDTATLKTPESWAMPGALETLRKISHHSEIFSTVVTGNYKQVAEAKLQAFGMLQLVCISSGAYGNECDSRADLIYLALQRAIAHTGTRFKKSNTIMIGDSAADVTAARKVGTRCVALSTGQYTPDELSSLGADIVLKSLDDFCWPHIKSWF